MVGRQARLMPTQPPQGIALAGNRGPETEGWLFSKPDKPPLCKQKVKLLNQKQFSLLLFSKSADTSRFVGSWASYTGSTTVRCLRLQIPLPPPQLAWPLAKSECPSSSEPWEFAVKHVPLGMQRGPHCISRKKFPSIPCGSRTGCLLPTHTRVMCAC